MYPNQPHAAYNSIPFYANQCTYQQVYAAAQFGSSPIQINAFNFAPNTSYNGQTLVLNTLIIRLGYTDRSPGGLSSNLPDNPRGSLTEVLNSPGYTRVINSSGTEDFTLDMPFTTPFCYDPSNGNLLVEIVVDNTSFSLGTSRCAGVPDASRAYNSSFFGNGADNVAQRIDFDISQCSGGGLALRLSGQCPGQVNVAWSNATPNKTMGIVFAASTGNFVIPGGPCGGTTLGLSSNQLRLVNTVNTGSGSGNVNGNAGTPACGRYIQLVVVDGNPCTTSNTAQLP